jgi:ankyrin repeat protein
MTGSLAKVQAAIAEGADIDALDRDRRTPLFYAAGYGATEVVAELIRSGADPNKRDKNLETPLHFAAREYHIETGRLLLKHGAAVDAQDADGNTPLSHAVFYSRGRGDAIKLLLSFGADRTLCNRADVSPEKLANTIKNFDVRLFLTG